MDRCGVYLVRMHHILTVRFNIRGTANNSKIMDISNGHEYVTGMYFSWLKMFIEYTLRNKGDCHLVSSESDFSV
jgi:hypothetical protein